MKQISQGTLEYLLIIAIIIVIALVVVGLSSGFLNTSQGTAQVATKIQNQTGIVSLTEASLDTDGNYLLILNGKEADPITITNIKTNDTNQSYSEQLSLGTQKAFQISTTENCTLGQLTTTIVTITYQTRHGITKTQTLTATPNCENYTTSATIAIPTTTATTLPTVTLSAPVDGNVNNSGTTNFSFSITNSTDVTGCYLYFDGNSLADTNTDVATGGDGTYTFTDFSLASYGYDANKQWDVNCTKSDTNYNSGTPYNILHPSTYLSSTGPGTGEILHYKMNDNAASTDVIDSVGSYTGTSVQNTSVMNSTPGKVNDALSFNGTSDYITTGTLPALDDFTISMWVYINANSSSWDAIMHSPSSAMQFYLWNGTTTVDWYISSHSGGWAQTSGSIGTGGWHHVVVVREIGSVPRIYFDSSLQALANSAVNSGTLSSEALYIGNQTGQPSRTFNGKMDDIRIYNRALSATDINAIYNLGNGTESDSNNSFVADETLSANFRPNYDSSNTYWYKWYKDNDLNATTLLTNGLVSYWPLDNDALDYNGTNDGTVSGATPTTGKIGGGYSFDGSSYIYSDSISSSAPSGAHTFSLWIQQTTGTQYSFLGASNNTDSVRILWFGIPGQINLAGIGVGCAWCYATTTDSYPANTLYHLVGIMDPGNPIQIFINGKEATYSTQHNSPTINYDILTNFAIGAGSHFGQTTGQTGWTGMLDEFQIYNRVLTEEEISQLYYGGLYDGNKMAYSQTTAGEEWKVGYQKNSVGGLAGWSTDVNSTAVTIT